MERYDTLCDRTYSKMLHFLFLMFYASPGFGMPDNMQQNKYVIGGKDTNITEVPYQAAFYSNGEFTCGAIIVSERYLLTAAHCINRKGNKYSVRVGSSFKDKGGVIHKIKRAVAHPLYEHQTPYYDYDVSFLEVERPIKFNAYVQPIRVANKEPKAGTRAKISGYGRDKGLKDSPFVSVGNNFYGFHESVHYPNQLQSAEILILDRGRCNDVLNHTVSRRMICTTSKDSNTCAHKGDSGGPLVVNGKVAGGASWFYYPPCKYPFIYSNFADKEIRKFIRKNTGV